MLGISGEIGLILTHGRRRRLTRVWTVIDFRLFTYNLKFSPNGSNDIGNSQAEAKLGLIRYRRYCNEVGKSIGT
jgi:hypothetical protein